jgi:hypothetical protein
LLGIESESELRKSPFLGPLFEGFIAAEIVKSQVNAGRRRELYYFRDQQGLEVDFVLAGRGGGLRLVETKAGKTVTPGMAAPMRRLAEAWNQQSGTRGAVEMFLVYQAPRVGTTSRATAPGVQALPWQEFVTQEIP